jgi:hypothetical protein
MDLTYLGLKGGPAHRWNRPAAGHGSSNFRLSGAVHSSNLVDSGTNVRLLTGFNGANRLEETRYGFDAVGQDRATLTGWAFGVIQMGGQPGLIKCR